MSVVISTDTCLDVNTIIGNLHVIDKSKLTLKNTTCIIGHVIVDDAILYAPNLGFINGNVDINAHSFLYAGSLLAVYGNFIVQSNVALAHLFLI